MIQYHLIKIGTLYLTDDTLIGGVKYITRVDGLEKFFTTDDRRINRALDGTVYLQKRSNVGSRVSINIQGMTNAHFASFVSMLDGYDIAGTVCALEFSGGNTGDHSFTAQLLGIEQTGEFLDSKVLDVVFRFIIISTGDMLIRTGSYSLTGNGATLTYTPV